MGDKIDMPLPKKPDPFTKELCEKLGLNGFFVYIDNAKPDQLCWEFVGVRPADAIQMMNQAKQYIMDTIESAGLRPAEGKKL